MARCIYNTKTLMDLIAKVRFPSAAAECISPLGQFPVTKTPLALKGQFNVEIGGEVLVYNYEFALIDPKAPPPRLFMDQVCSWKGFCFIADAAKTNAHKFMISFVNWTDRDFYGDNFDHIKMMVKIKFYDDEDSRLYLPVKFSRPFSLTLTHPELCAEAEQNGGWMGKKQKETRPHHPQSSSSLSSSSQVSNHS